MSTATSTVSTFDSKQREWLIRMGAALGVPVNATGSNDTPLTGASTEAVWEHKQPALNDADATVRELEDAQLSKAPIFRKGIILAHRFADQNKFAEAVQAFDALEPKIKEEYAKLQKSRGGGVQELGNGANKPAQRSQATSGPTSAAPDGAKPAAASDDPKAAEYKNQILKVGSKGPAVEYLQKVLGQGLGVDGKFGPGTQKAVQAFQKTKALKPDGIVGPKTWAALGGGASDAASPPSAKSAGAGSATAGSGAAKADGSASPAKGNAEFLAKQGHSPGDVGSEHPVATGTASVSVSVGTTMTAEAGLRQVYQQGAEQITQRALQMVREGGGTPEAVETAARWANQARNDLKVAIRARGSVITEALAKARNIRKYGNEVGPTFDELIAAGKAPEEIIGSAGRASRTVSTATESMRVAGGFLIVVSVGIATWQVVEAPDGQKGRTAAGAAGGLGGGLVGAELGAEGGAEVGALIGTFIEPGLGTVIGAGIGGIIGGVGGAIGGGELGTRAAEETYDVISMEINAPHFEANAAAIDAEQDRKIRAAGN